MEEAVPYDFFMPQIFDGEEFTRFARLWTRGYDVYTPSKNIVFHDANAEPDGHDGKGWPKSEVISELSVQRAKTLLQMPAGDHSEAVQANFGLYGLGKRRSMDEFKIFIGVEFDVDVFRPPPCGKKQWVPYDLSLSATENLYDHPNDLDPQPEFPLRTISQQPKISPDESTSFLNMQEGSETDILLTDKMTTATETTSGMMSPSVTFALWMFGLFLWYKFFVAQQKTYVRGGLHSKAKKIGRKPQNGIGIGAMLNSSFSAGEKDA
jgi:hypothetical protein